MKVTIYLIIIMLIIQIGSRMSVEVLNSLMCVQSSLYGPSCLYFVTFNCARGKKEREENNANYDICSFARENPWGARLLGAGSILDLSVQIFAAG